MATVLQEAPGAAPLISPMGVPTREELRGEGMTDTNIKGYSKRAAISLIID
jgi:hypothetical protein